MNQKKQVAKAFELLREKGYFAEENFWCCQNCGWNAMTDKQAEKAVFYHGQDNESWNEKTGNLKTNLYIGWSGDCHEIRNIFESVGLLVEHDGTEGSRIEILA